MSAFGAGSFRNISIALQCNAAPYVAGMGLAAERTKQFGRDLKQVGDAGEQDLKRVGDRALLVGGAMVAGFGLAVARMADFDQAMSNVGAVAGATGPQLLELRDAALEAGQATVFSASEAADAQGELAKAGVATADILGGALKGALDLAAAGGLDLATAAEYAATTMTQFGLAGRDVPYIADLLAAAANKSSADVSDLGYSLKYVGLAAHGLGIGVDETTGALAAFASAGLKGEQAGTSFRGVLAKMSDQSREGRQLMDELGIAFYDNEGRFKGLAGVAEELQTKLAGLTQEQREQAFATLFGTESANAARVLYQQGAEGISAWTSAVDQSGYASQIAAAKTDNLRGDLEELGGSIETALIRSGEDANGVLRGLASAATDMVNGTAALPPIVENTATAFFGLAGAGTLAVGVWMKAKPAVDNLKASLTEMGPVGSSVAGNLNTIGLATGAAAAGLAVVSAGLGQAQREGQAMVETFQQGFKPAETLQDFGKQINATIAYYDDLQSRLASHNVLDEMGEVITFWDENRIGAAENATVILQDLIGNKMMPEYEHWSEATSRLAGELGVTEEEAQRLAAAAGVDLRGAAATLGDQLGLTEEQQLALNQAMADAGFGIDQDVAAVKTYYGALNTGLSPAQDRVNKLLEGMADKTKSAEDRFKTFADLVDDHFDAAINPRAELDEWQAKLNGLADAALRVQSEGGGFWNFMANGSDAAIAFRSQMDGIVRQGGDLMKLWADGKISAEEYQSKIDTLGLQLLVTADRAQVPRDVTQVWLGMLQNIDAASWQANITAPGADLAITQTAALEQNLLRITGSPWVAHVGVSLFNAGQGIVSKFVDAANSFVGPYAAGYGSYQPRADGGPVSGGNMYGFLERGEPELLQLGSNTYLGVPPGQSGMVTPVGRMVNPPSGSGGGTVVTVAVGGVSVDARGASNPDAVGAAVERAIDRALSNPRQLDRLVANLGRRQHGLS